MMGTAFQGAVLPQFATREDYIKFADTLQAVMDAGSMGDKSQMD